MKSIALLGTVGFLAGIMALNAQAVTVYECVDGKGERFLADHCPPNTIRAGQIQVRVRSTKPTPEEAAAEQSPVALFAVPVCDACDLVRNQLQKRGIPFVEKDPSNDGAIQTELKELAGSLTVPTITIGEKILTGYNKQALDESLDGAGYAKPEPPQSEATADSVPAN